MIVGSWSNFQCLLTEGALFAGRQCAGADATPTSNCVPTPTALSVVGPLVTTRPDYFVNRLAALRSGLRSLHAAPGRTLQGPSLRQAA